VTGLGRPEQWQRAVRLGPVAQQLLNGLDVSLAGSLAQLLGQLGRVGCLGWALLGRRSLLGRRGFLGRRGLLGRLSLLGPLLVARILAAGRGLLLSRGFFLGPGLRFLGFGLRLPGLALGLLAVSFSSALARLPCFSSPFSLLDIIYTCSVAFTDLLSF
jgi:hypothetical protein